MELEQIEGTVEDIIYENPDNGYTVFEISGGGTVTVVCGIVGELHAGEHGVRVVNQILRLGSQTHPASHMFQEHDAGLPLQKSQLLGHGRRRVRHRPRDLRQRPHALDLAKHTEPLKIEHSFLPPGIRGRQSFPRIFRDLVSTGCW